MKHSLSLLAAALSGVTLLAGTATAAFPPLPTTSATLHLSNGSKKPVPTRVSKTNAQMIKNHSQVTPGERATFEGSGFGYNLYFDLTVGPTGSPGSCLIHVVANPDSGGRGVTVEKAGDGSQGYTCYKQGNSVVLSPVPVA